MTRSNQVRYLRTEPTMAYPDGRIIRTRGGTPFVLAVDGWLRVGGPVPSNARRISRQDAESWCAAAGWDPTLLDQVPADERES